MVVMAIVVNVAINVLLAINYLRSIIKHTLRSKDRGHLVGPFYLRIIDMVYIKYVLSIRGMRCGECEAHPC